MRIVPKRLTARKQYVGLCQARNAVPDDGKRRHTETGITGAVQHTIRRPGELRPMSTTASLYLLTRSASQKWRLEMEQRGDDAVRGKQPPVDRYRGKYFI